MKMALARKSAGDVGSDMVFPQPDGSTGGGEDSGSDPEKMKALAGVYLQLRRMLYDPKGPVKVEDVLR